MLKSKKNHQLQDFFLLNKCTNGTLFDEGNLVCDFPWNVDCGNRGELPGQTSDTFGSVFSVGLWWCEQGNQGVFYSEENGVKKPTTNQSNALKSAICNLI